MEKTNVEEEKKGKQWKTSKCSAAFLLVHVNQNTTVLWNISRLGQSVESFLQCCPPPPAVLTFQCCLMAEEGLQSGIFLKNSFHPCKKYWSAVSR